MKHLIAYGLLFFTLYSCGVKHDMSIKDPSKSERFSFKAPEDSHSASLFINGESNGDFEIHISSEGNLYQKHIIHSGTIDTVFSSDWYGAEMGIKYLPLNTSEGELEMQCVFYY